VLAKDAFVPKENCKLSLKLTRTDVLRPGSGYVLGSNTFHTLSDFKDGTITLVVRS
jgi:hypothetical protein